MSRSLPFRRMLPALLALPPLGARAQEVTPIDLGLLRNEEISVVQKRLYPKAKRSELGLHLGLLPFDPYTTAPQLGLDWTRHRSETLGFGLSLDAGYGFKNATYHTLESPTYGVAPEAYRFLGRAAAGVEWTPIYAKMNWLGKQVYHYDTYLRLQAGGTLEQSVLPTAYLAACPTLGWGVGFRVFRSTKTALHLAFRHDLLLEYRQQTETLALKHNAGVLVGISRFGKGAGR